MKTLARLPLTLTSLALLLFTCALALLAQSGSDLDTPDQQAEVRSSRDVSTLPLQSSCTVVPAKELFITDVSVVDDCYRTTFGQTCPPPVQPATRGAWTLAGLLPGVFGTSNTTTLSTLTLDWLHNWLVDGSINGDPVPARKKMQALVINPWLVASGNTGQLDLKVAPFRLTAIVARLDLREPDPKRTGGELRFVFNLLDLSQSPPATTPFNLILEYGLDAANCQDILSWATSFHALGSVPFGANYDADLEAITDRVTAIGASPLKPNGSAIDQIRTNEIFLTLQTTQLWELREFHTVDAQTGHGLIESTVAETPAFSTDFTQPVADFIINNAGSIYPPPPGPPDYTVPLTFEGDPFRGGAAPHPANGQGQPNLVWDGPPPACSSFTTTTQKQARGVFSLNTCQGCHGKETAILDFVQVEQRDPGHAAALSVFLTGGPTGVDTVTDICGIVHNFNDLNRRRVDLCQLLQKTCTQIDAEPVVSFPE
jgi:hypothetical protein